MWLCLGPRRTSADGSAGPAGKRGRLTGPRWPRCSLATVCGVLLNAAVPDSGRATRAAAHDPATLVREFPAANRKLWCDREGGALAGRDHACSGASARRCSSPCCGGRPSARAVADRRALLQAAVAVGVIAGAAAAGDWLHSPHQARCSGPAWRSGLMLARGRRGVSARGAAAARPRRRRRRLVVVPLNALLQHSGQEVLSAGRSIAVQGFNENLSMLAMLAGYAGCAAGVPIAPLQRPASGCSWPGRSGVSSLGAGGGGKPDAR